MALNRCFVIVWPTITPLGVADLKRKSILCGPKRGHVRNQGALVMRFLA